MHLVSKRMLFGLAFSLLSCLSGLSQADIVFTSNVKADFTFTTVGTTLGLPDGTVLPFTALGSMTFTLDLLPAIRPASALSGETVLSFVDATGSLTVDSPAGFAGATMGPYAFAGGRLDGITYDRAGNITGGRVADLSMLWEMQLGPTRLYTKDPLPFNGFVTGAPFGVGDVISGPLAFDVFLDLGNPATDPLVAIGQDRFLTITAVPEPSSFALIGIAAGTAFRFRRRRQVAVSV
jgi:hypothetical protein